MITTRSSRRLVAAAAAFVAAASLPACAVYEPPRFEVSGVSETEASDEARVLRFELSAVNPNDRALPLREARYRLVLDGAQVFDAQRSAMATAPAYGSQPVELPVVVTAERFDLSRLDSGELPYTLTGSVEYQTPGQLAEVLFDTGVRRLRAPIRLRGTLDLGENGPGENDPGQNRPTPDAPGDDGSR